MNRTLMFVCVLGFVLAMLLGNSLFQVDQTEQVLIVQLGQPERMVRRPGLHAKLPFVQTALAFDKRLLDYELPEQEVILGDQRRLIVDCFTRYRIDDPLRYYQAVGPSEEAIRGRLNAIVSSALRRVLGNEKLLAVLSAERDRIMGEIRTQVNREMETVGVSVLDVRIRRADLPQENTDAILARMQSERERIAKQVRAEGAEAAARVRADAERDRTVLLANAHAKADALRGEGEGDAIRIYADAAQNDPVFFIQWRSLRAYHAALARPQTRLMLSPDSDFLALLRHAPGFTLLP